jgi:quinohemoprotein ethanol dehydrogenase
MPVNGLTTRTYLAIPFALAEGRSIQDNGTPRGGRLSPQVTATPVTPPFIGPSRDLRGGYLVAFDPARRLERWRVEGGGGSGGGVLVTAATLVFQVIGDGRFRALGADDGRVLWEMTIGQSGTGPPITYQVDGRQYVSFMAGTGGRGAGSLRPMVYTFALDGKASLPAASAPR